MDSKPNNSIFNYFQFKLQDFNAEKLLDESSFLSSNYRPREKMTLFKEDDEEKEKYELMKELKFKELDESFEKEIKETKERGNKEIFTGPLKTSKFLLKIRKNC